MGSSSGLVLVLVVMVAVVLSGAGRGEGATFKCNSTGSTCRALIDYVSPNTTTLDSIKKLFSIKKLRVLLGANDLSPSTDSNYTVNKSQTLKIPFPCSCNSSFNSTGISNKTPIYTVVPDDGLYHIAAEVYAGLVTFQEIAAVNNITNVDLIEVGQKLWIPLPCSCDELGGGERVVHYGHVVEAGNSLQEIAQEYGTTQDTLMSLNGIANASSLQAGQVIDVPLQACNSSVRSDSVDYPLLVANGTYLYTANNCVRCTCDSANNWTLQCEPTGLQPSNWSTCPTMQCEGAGNLYLSNTTSSCGSSTCSYAGFYSNQTILTTLVTESTCSTNSPSPGNHAPRTSASASASWIFLLICVHLVTLSVHFL